MMRSDTTVFDAFFFFNDTATTEIYTLSLHDALPIWKGRAGASAGIAAAGSAASAQFGPARSDPDRFDPWRFDLSVSRSEEHTSELQSRQYLVCRLLLEKKKLITTPSFSFYHLSPFTT